MRRIKVVAAVIQNTREEVLIARRPDHLHQGGLWEFPGGKIEARELPCDALTRELDEELGIQVTSARPLMKVSHDYEDKAVELDVWRVDGFDGIPTGREGQEVLWVRLNTLSQFEFPQANRDILRALSEQS